MGHCSNKDNDIDILSKKLETLLTSSAESSIKSDELTQQIKALLLENKRACKRPASIKRHEAYERFKAKAAEEGKSVYTSSHRAYYEKNKEAIIAKTLEKKRLAREKARQEE
jgi:hypothetical protein